MISLSSRKQGSIAQSTVEAECLAASDANKKAILLKKLLFGLFSGKLDLTIIQCDNLSCIKLVFQDRLKHTEMKYHFIRDLVQRGTLKLQYICIDEQIAEILTKPLTTTKFVYFHDKLGMVENTSLAEREC